MPPLLDLPTGYRNRAQHPVSQYIFPPQSRALYRSCVEDCISRDANAFCGSIHDKSSILLQHWIIARSQYRRLEDRLWEEMDGPQRIEERELRTMQCGIEKKKIVCEVYVALWKETRQGIKLESEREQMVDLMLEIGFSTKVDNENNGSEEAEKSDAIQWDSVDALEGASSQKNIGVEGPRSIFDVHMG